MFIINEYKKLQKMPLLILNHGDATAWAGYHIRSRCVPETSSPMPLPFVSLVGGVGTHLVIEKAA